MTASSPEKSVNPEREQRILDAAAQLIIRYGYDKTAVSDIAQEAGISKGAIYLHFQSKEELFEALLLRELLRYSEDWLVRVEADPRGGTLSGVYRNALYSVQANPFMRALFTQDRRIMGAYLRRENNIFRSRVGMRTGFIQMMQELGAVRTDIKPEIVAHIMNMLSFALVSIDEVFDADQIPPLDATIEGIADVLDWALTPESGFDAAHIKRILRDMLRGALEQLRQSSASPLAGNAAENQG